MAVCVISVTSAVFAQPCTCPAQRAPAVALGESDAVFEAQVTGLRLGTYSTGVGDPIAGRWISLLVIREWKGATAGTTRFVFTPTLCEVSFETGTTWLVYARSSGNNHDLRTTHCHRTRLSNTAREDFVALGIPSTQIPALQPSVTARRVRPRPVIAAPRRGRRFIRRPRRHR
jgi:hypothetical protein